MSKPRTRKPKPTRASLMRIAADTLQAAMAVAEPDIVIQCDGVHDPESPEAQEFVAAVKQLRVAYKNLWGRQPSLRMEI